MQDLIAFFKEFNKKHKGLVPFVIYLEMAVITISSVFRTIFKKYKLVALAVLVIVVVLFGAKKTLLANQDVKETEMVAETEMVETISVEETLSNLEKDCESEVVADDKFGEDDTSDKETSNKKTDTSTSREAGLTSSDSGNIRLGSLAELPENMGKFIVDYPESVAWIWFEDDLISYPVMQSGDNTKYTIKDYEGNDSNTGSLFLDYRSSADFTDPNSIIYGHNMRDRTMFGALRTYKDDLGYLENHKYFQIITEEGRKRYMIFAFMDVPKDSYIYDVCGKNPDNMREFLDTIEYRTYIDTGIEPTVEDKIITLSTCTKKDSLFFVMFAVEVE